MANAEVAHGLVVSRSKGREALQSPLVKGNKVGMKLLNLPEVLCLSGKWGFFSFLKEEGIMMIITAPISRRYSEGTVGHIAGHIAFAEKKNTFFPSSYATSVFVKL